MASHGEGQKEWSAGCEKKTVWRLSRPGRRHGTPDADELGLEGWQTPCTPWMVLAWLAGCAVLCCDVPDRLDPELPVTDPSIPPIWRHVMSF